MTSVGMATSLASLMRPEARLVLAGKPAAEAISMAECLADYGGVGRMRDAEVSHAIYGNGGQRWWGC